MSLSAQETSTLSKFEAAEAQLVVFLLAGCEAAVSIRLVREIIRVGEITRMPKAPPFLEGILNLRGKIVPALDLKKRFEMPLIDRTEESRILVLEFKDQMMGFVVDKVSGVIKVSPDMVIPPQGPVLGVNPEFLDGLIPLGQRLILLINLKKLLTLDDTKALPGMETHAGPEGGTHGD
jgi:purine-binding chemotaxis protein CheW